MKKTSKKRNNTVIALLIMLSVVLSSGTFAYWASSIEGSESEAVGTITIGYAESVATAFELSNTLQDGGLLVPKGQAINSGDNAVEEINLSYNLQWKEENMESQLTGSVTTGKISISHDLRIKSNGEDLDPLEYSYIYDLINVHYDENNKERLTLDGDVENFLFTITMDEPANQEEYNIISKATVSIVFYYQILDNFIETVDIVIDDPDNNEDTLYVELGSEYSALFESLYDSKGGEMTNAWIDKDINLWVPGTYEVEYTGHTSYDYNVIETVKKTIVVEDTVAPTVTISGPDYISLSVGDSYSDWGAYANDKSGTQSSVTRVGSVDTSLAGTYYVSYYSTDASGNTGQAVKTIVVK